VVDAGVPGRTALMVLAAIAPQVAQVSAFCSSIEEHQGGKVHLRIDRRCLLLAVTQYFADLGQ
jgi:hypothetical protein